MGWPLKEVASGVFETEAPGGYKFYLEDKEKLKQGEIFTPTGVQQRFTSGVLECVYFDGILSNRTLFKIISLLLLKTTNDINCGFKPVICL